MATKTSAPIYASPGALDAFFGKLKNLNPPPTVDAKWVAGLGIGFPDAIVAAMKFLGAVDKDGKPQEVFAKLDFEGKPFQDALAGLVREAYKPVIGQFADFAKADMQDVNNAFKSTFQVGNPSRYVRPFLTLCGLAGILAPAEGAAAPKALGPRGPQATGAKEKKGERTVLPEGLRQAPVGLSLQLSIEIPWNASGEAIAERLRVIKDAIKDVG